VKSVPTSNPASAEAERLAAMVREQAADESAQALAAAREQAERIRAAAQAEAEVIRAAAEREGEARGRRRAAEFLAVARAQRQMRLLQVREALIEAALTRARAQLASGAATSAGADTLAELVRDGLRLLPPGPVRVRVGQGDAALLGPSACDALGAGRWTLRVESDAVPGGGVMLESADGRLCFDNSFDARCRRRRDRVRRLAASLLLLDAEAASGRP
jgi:vacuolar-type H+-ATPase subunit E/Vma4